MSGLFYFGVTFHLFPLFVFFLYKNNLKFENNNFLIAGLIFSSFLADLIALWLANSGINTNLVSTLYIITERIISILIVISLSSILLKIKKLLLTTITVVSIYQIVSNIINRCLVYNDYINLISGVILCLFSLHTLFTLTSKTIVDSSEIDIRIWPVLALFFFMSATLIPDMITNIDDTVDFPIFFQYVRIGVTIGSNIIRDSLFALFFIQAKKLNYVPSK